MSKKTGKCIDPWEEGQPALKAKQKRFAQEYLVDLNATQAAIRAGYTKASAHVQGCELLKNPKVAAYIAQAQTQRAERTKVSQDDVLQALSDIAFANAGDFFTWGSHGVTINESADLTDAQRAVVSEVSETVTQHGGTIRVKLYSRTDALKLLGQHLGMFVERHEHTGTVGLHNMTDEELLEKAKDAERTETE